MFNDDGINGPWGTVGFGSGALLEKYDEKSEKLFSTQNRSSSMEEYEQALKDKKEYEDCFF